MRELTEDERIDELVQWLYDGTTRRIRERAGWSRERCARHIGVDEQTILRWEHGRNLPGRAVGLRFHKLLGELRDAPAAPSRSARFDNRGAKRQGADS
jgi:ribosome-binding protein aMBF1 (putative translation factor)